MDGIILVICMLNLNFTHILIRFKMSIQTHIEVIRSSYFINSLHSSLELLGPKNELG